MKRLYNRIAKIYGHLTGPLDQIYDTIIEKRLSKIPNSSSCTALEYACGTGLLSLKLSPLFQSVKSRDLSSGMLEIARRKAGTSFKNVTFSEGDILNIDEPDKSFDYVFVSFALHLFPLETEKQILKNLCRVARKAVFIIDHSRKWDLPIPTAIVEWIEGGYYDQFIRYDFKKIAGEIGCSSFSEEPFTRSMLLSFYP
jgi:ubiquinone/menaquinone biosynthesis C-methylase UbiE